MHLRQIGNGTIKVVERIIKNYFSAIRDKIAERILKCKFIFAHPCRAVSIGGSRCLPVGAGVVRGSQHSIIKKTEPGRKRAVKGGFCRRKFHGIQNFSSLHRGADRQKN